MHKPIEQTYQTHRQSLVTRASWRLHDWHEAEDVVQDAFVRVMERGYRDDTDLKGLVRVTAKRLALNTVDNAVSRREKQSFVAVSSDCEDTEPKADIIALVHKAVKQLSANDQAVLSPVAGVEKRDTRRERYRALKHLREILKRTQAYKEGVLTTCL